MTLDLKKDNTPYPEIIKMIFRNWYWPFGFMLASLLCAWIYLRYTPPLYATEASLKFEEKKSELSELINIRNLYDRTNKVESEKIVIRSRAVALKALESMDYKISWFIKGNFRTTDIYPKKPLLIVINNINPDRIYPIHFEFRGYKKRQFVLSYVLHKQIIKRTFHYGQLISIPNLSFRIFPGQQIDDAAPTYVFKFNNPLDFLNYVDEALKIDDNQNVNVLRLKITHTNPYFAADALNAIVRAYLKFDRMQRSASATQTMEFIDKLLKNMSATVNLSAKHMAKFKSDHSLSSQSGGSLAILEKYGKLEAERHILSEQELSIQQQIQSLNTSEYTELPNANLQGNTDEQLRLLILNYNELLQQKTEASQRYNFNSEQIKTVDEQIGAVRKAIKNNLEGQQHKNLIIQRFLTQEFNKIKMSYETMPETERQYNHLQSTFDINEKVFRYLSEKKLESQISKASIIPGSVIIDSAIYSRKPIEPNARNTYTLCFLGGITSGILVIFGIKLINPYLYDRETVESLTPIPILGIIQKYKGSVHPGKIQIHAINDPKSLFSESVRAVRSNLNFLTSEKGCKTICITSEISGEGKSFIATNLAATLSLIEKKVILIATDLRKHKIEWENLNDNSKGLSSYLSGQACIGEIIGVTLLKNLHTITSGAVPPNPSELLHVNKMQELIEILKRQYDFIIIDSAPIGLVSDAIPILRMADINLFVIRHGVSAHSSALLPEKLVKEHQLSNPAIVLNAFKYNNSQKRY